MTERAQVEELSFLKKGWFLGQAKRKIVHLNPYVAATVNCSNIVWFKQLLEGMKQEIKEPVVMFCDNTSAFNIFKNLVMHSKTKYIAMKYHFFRELVQEKEIKLENIHTKEQIVDIFTKPLSKDAFLYQRGKLGVIPLSKAH